MRFKLLTAVGVFVVGVIVFLAFGDQLISLYLTGEGDDAERAAILAFGSSYLRIMLWGLAPFAVSHVYAGTLRETGRRYFR